MPGFKKLAWEILRKIFKWRFQIENKQKKKHKKAETEFKYQKSVSI